MTEKIRKMAVLAVAVVAPLGVVASSEAAQYTINFNHVVAPNAPKGMAAEFFKQRAEELTHGQVVVNVYPSSKKFTDKDEMIALQTNIIQMAAPSLSNLSSGGYPKFEVFDLPYLFQSMDDVHKVTYGSAGRELFRELEYKNLKGLAYWDNDFKEMSLNAPITGPESFNGKKLRIQNSNVLMSQMEALGASPIKLSFSKVYESLKAGTIDGCENPISNFYTKKFYEHQPYLAMTNHGYLGYAVLTNLEFWNSLPNDVQGQLEQAMKETTVYANKVAASKAASDLELVKMIGTTQVVELTPKQRNAFRRALYPVHQQSVARVGQATLDSVYAAIGFNQSMEPENAKSDFSAQKAEAESTVAAEAVPQSKPAKKSKKHRRNLDLEN